MNERVEMETGTGSFLDRQALTRRLEENLEAFLAEYGFKMLPFGHPAILQDNSWMRSRLRRLEIKDSLSAIMVKFSPDYVVVKDGKPRKVFFMDAKVSVTPVFFNAHIERIKEHYGKDRNLSREDIMEIEREAWLSYNKFYPPEQVALVIATPYNPRLILAEWVSNIECMWCIKKAQEGNPIPWQCDSCPVFLPNDEGFGVMVNEFAGGSKTPHTNIHFGSMRTLDEFLRIEFGVKIDREDYEATMLEYVKTWPLSKPAGRVSWSQFNSAIKQLKRSCPWLKCRVKDKFIPCPGEDQGSFL